MALSNIFREPRREITETLMGIAVLVLPVYADYHFAGWFETVTSDSHGNGCPLPIGMVLGALFLFLSFLALFGIHVLGEAICNAMARRGLELRPKIRYRG